MKAISKKLLSLLVVIAMVLSMVPFGGLSIFAVETKAALTETEQTTVSEAISDAEEIKTAASAMDFTDASNLPTTCPVCGEGASWTAISEATTLTAGHYYLSDDITSDAETAVFTNSAKSGETVCLHLNGHSVTSTANTVFSSYQAGTVNVFGDDTNIISGAYAYSGKAIVWGGGTLNIYGGFYTKPATITSAVVSQSGGKINQYGGIIDGTSDEATWVCSGIYITNGTYNMYGGTIQNGSGTAAGGNVNLYASKPNKSVEFNMYGGTVKDGKTTTATSAAGGGNFYVYKSGTSDNSTEDTSDDGPYTNALNLYGGTVSGGVSEGNYGDGGNIFTYGPVTIGDGVATDTEITVSGGSATYMGGSIYLAATGANLTVNDGALLSGSATSQAAYGGIVGTSGGVIITVNGGKITDGTAGRGGNIDLSGAGKLYIKGGEVSNGESTGHGGNIFAQNTGAVIEISGGEVKDGVVSVSNTKYGGNIYLTKGTLTVSGTAQITGGTANQGAGIYVGGEIDSTTHAAKDVGTLKITGGTITGGEATYGDAIRMGEASELIMTGGTVDGQIQPADNCCTYGNGTITVSGEAKITGHGLDCGADGIILTDAGLTEGASIAVYQSGRPFVQYTDEAAATAAKGYYTGSQYGYGVVVNDDGTLEIGKVGVYCEACQTTITDWTARTASTSQDSQGHWYLASDVTTDKDQTIYVNNTGTTVGCLDLNGHTLSMTGRIGLTASGTTLNIMDSAGGGEVITSGSRTASALYNYAIRVQSTNNTVNLYGGTYKNTNGTTAVISVAGSGNVLNIYEGAVIDGTETTRGVYVTTGTVNLKGGTIKDGYTTASGGNIQLDAGTFEMTSGYVIDGYAGTHGGNISGVTGTTVKITGGEVSGGTAWYQGGNIRIWQGALTVGGTAEIYDGTSNTSGESDARNGNIWVQGTDATSGQSLTITGGEIAGDILVGNGPLTLSGAPTITMGKNNGLINSGDAADISGLAVVDGKEPEIWVTASKGAVISESYTGADDLVDYFYSTNSAYKVAVDSDNCLYIAEAAADYPDPEEGVFDPESCGGKAYCPICGTIQDWTAVSGVTTLVAGHYYLSADIESDSATAVLTATAAEGETTCLHLNGKSITTAAATTSGLVLHGTGAGTLNITGAGTDAEILHGKTTNTAYLGRTIKWDAGILNIYTGTITRTGYRAVVHQTGGVINQRGGTIDGTGTTYNWYGGGVWMTGGEYNMYDGATIQNGKGTTGGGNVSVYGGEGSRATFNMYGGTVKDGEAKNAGTDYTQGNGGNFYVLTGNTLNLYGGLVTGGKAYGDYYNNNSYGYGGNIYSNGTVTIGDGEATGTEITIENGKAGSWGGNINCQSGSTLYIKAGALITGGDTTDATYGADDTATRNYGGNISAGGSAKVYMSGGTVTGGTSYRGGNFDLSGAGTLEITGGTVSDGNSTYGGGNIYFQNGSATVTISGANTEISGGKAPSGGNIRANGGTLKIQGGIISGGTATGSVANSGLGGNIYISGATMEMTDGTITGGTANWIATDNGDGSYTYTNGNGGNIYSTNGTLTIQGGTVSGGTAGCFGGNILVSGGSFTVLAADSSNPVQFTGGQTKLWHGGNLCLNNTTASIDGAVINGGAAGDGVDYSAKDGTSVYHGTTGQGGAIRAYNCGTLEIKNSTVTAGTAIGGNQGIWAFSCDVSLTDTTVTGVDGAYRGSGVSMASSGKTLTISGNSSITNADNNALRMVNGAILSVAEGWSGNVGVHLEEKAYSAGETVNNASCTGDYTGTLMNSNGDKVAIVADGTSLVLAGYGVVAADDTTEWFANSSDAIDAIDEGEYLVAAADVEVAEGKTVYIDALKAITVTGTGTAYGIDPANADFTTASTGSFSGNVQSDATFNGVRYLKIADGTVHAIEMGITGVSLRPSAVGLYYKATYKCDETLAAAITAYGVVLSVNDMPGANFVEDPTDQFTVIEGTDHYDAEKHQISANSGSVFGIMKDGKDNNQERGEMKIYANAYILVNNEAIYVGDTENADKGYYVKDADGNDTEEVNTEFTGVALSLYDVLKKVDDKVSDGTLTLTATNIAQITALYEKIKAWGVDWTFQNIQ